MHKIEYHATANLTRDNNIDMDYHPSLGELNDIYKQVQVGFTEREWKEYQQMKGLRKSLYLREKALEQIQINSSKEVADILFHNQDEHEVI